MCGIVGAVTQTQDINWDSLKTVLMQRGPDAQCYVHEGPVFLGHTRLAIQDIQDGAQPFVYQDWSIIFNGEIYNHLELRNKIIYDWKTRSDTETLLQLWIKFGADILSDIDGMFAFAIYQKSTGTVFLARDRAGKKPLYFSNSNKGFFFGSRLDLFKYFFNTQVNSAAIARYLRFGFMFNTDTPYDNVEEFPSGSWASYSIASAQLTVNRWWNRSIIALKDRVASLDEGLALTEAALDESVRNRMMSSDLEVGVFLSGGIDSGLVTAFAARYTKKLKSFSVRFPGVYDESDLARATAHHCGTEHHFIDVNFDSLNSDIGQILSEYGEPFADSSAIPSYYVAKAAKQHLTVALNGDGADELFGGYRRYVPLKIVGSLLGNPLTGPLFKGISDLMPKPQQKMAGWTYLYRLMFALGASTPQWYLALTSDIFEGFESILTQPADLSGLSKIIKNSYLPELAPAEQQMRSDFSVLLLGDLLPKMDVATMAHSVEVRSPFLSKAMLDLSPRIAPDLKVLGTETKLILRRLSQKYLPSEIGVQPKRGFEVPLNNWVNNTLKSQIHDLVTPTGFSSQYVDPKFIRDLLDDRVRVMPEKRAKMLWVLFCLESWHATQFQGSRSL